MINSTIQRKNSQNTEQNEKKHRKLDRPRKGWSDPRMPTFRPVKISDNIQLWAYTGEHMPDELQVGITQVMSDNVGRSPSISQANITLRNSANKHAEIIDAILSGPTNDTAIEVKNVTLATASILLRMLADAL